MKEHVDNTADVFFPALTEAAIAAGEELLKAVPFAYAGTIFLNKLLTTYRANLDRRAAGPERAKAKIEADPAQIANVLTICGINEPENRKDLLYLTREFVRFQNEFPEFPFGFLFYVAHIDRKIEGLSERVMKLLTGALSLFENERNKFPRHVGGMTASLLEAFIQQRNREEFEDELRYLASVRNVYQYVDLIGISNITGPIRQRIDLAWVTLSSQLEDDPFARNPAKAGRGAKVLMSEASQIMRGDVEKESRERFSPLGTRFGSQLAARTSRKARVPMEEMVWSNKRLTIEGFAGSGKSTLLCYLTYLCTELMLGNRWVGLIPILVRLRETGGDLTIEKITKYGVRRTIPDEKWLRRKLKENRVLLMLDGVDELDASNRELFFQSIEDLSFALDENRIVITSRPLGRAIAGVGSERGYFLKQFKRSRIDRLDYSQIELVIQRWHSAIDPSYVSNPDEIETRCTELIQSIREQRNYRVAELCENPLLASMICALHYDNHQLPEKRVALYDKCISQMIETRDLRRKVPAVVEDWRDLDEEGIRDLLRRLSYKMLCEYANDEEAEIIPRIEADQDQVIGWIEKECCGSLNETEREGRAAEILGMLIRRVGLLQEPIEGKTIEFIHRTFQEFLAAEEFAREDMPKALAEKAGDELWRETILLSSGVSCCARRYRPAVVESLISEGNREASPLRRKACFALAIGSLENAESWIGQEPELKRAVLSKIPEIVPPINLTEATLLSAAGEALVPFLIYNSDQANEERAACAAALARIATPGAREQIRSGYIHDYSSAVINEVLRCQGIDPFECQLVRRELASGNHHGGYPFYAPYVRNLSLLTECKIDTSLDLSGCMYLEDIAELGRFTNLERLNLRGCGALSDLNPVSRLENIKYLNLENCASITDLTPISKLVRLKSIIIRGCSKIKDISPLKDLVMLKEVYLPDGVDDLSPLESLACLEILSMGRLGELRNLPEGIQRRRDEGKLEIVGLDDFVKL